MSTPASRADLRTPTAVLVAGGAILTLGMGIRHGFGLFLQPMSNDLGWGRETFALALAAGGAMRITELAGRQLLDRTALSRNLDPLIERGLVAVSPGRDARTREVALTAKGAAALRRAKPLWERAQEDVARRVGQAKLATLIGILGELEGLHPDRGAKR